MASLDNRGRRNLGCDDLNHIAQRVAEREQLRRRDGYVVPRSTYWRLEILAGGSTRIVCKWMFLAKDERTDKWKLASWREVRELL